MRRALSILTLFPLAFFASGCVNALRQASPPTEVRLGIRSVQPEQYSVRVALTQAANYPVAADGRVTFTVPSFRHGCDMYLFGGFKVRDGSAEGVRVVELRRNDRAVRRLSLAQIAKLPRDEAGYSAVRIGD
jgi:hypothetical protein